MGDGTKESPLTRKDILKLRKENGKTAKGLDLSGKIFEDGINLGKLDLRGIILRDTTLKGAHLEGAMLAGTHLEGAYLSNAHLEGANLSVAHLEGAYLYDAHLEGADLNGVHLEGASLPRAHLEGAWLLGAHLKGADLVSAHLEGADLSDAHFEGAYLIGAHLEGAYLSLAEFSPDTKLEYADWGNYIVGEEEEGDFTIAADTYRRLKQWHTTAGMYDRAGEFYYREMTAKRKNYWWQGIQSKSFQKLLYGAWSKFLSVLCGYGERPLRVVISALVVVLGSALIYFAIGTLTPNTFPNSLYYSAVSFTALGYGRWAPEPTGWVKGLGAAEAFAGVFMMALFLITFTRKMTR